MNVAGSPWTDQSPTAASFTAAGGAEPAYSASDAHFNGQPSLAFTAATPDGLTSSAAASVYRDMHDGTGITIALVLRTDAGGTLQTILDTNNFGSGRGCTIAQTAGNALRLQIRTASASIVDDSSVDLATSTTHRLVIRFRDAAGTPEWIITKGGVDSASGDTTGAPEGSDAPSTLVLGRRTVSTLNAFNGKLAFIAMWSQSFGAAQMAQLNQYLSARYG